MNWLSETPRTLICALAEWYGKRTSRLFASGVFCNALALYATLRSAGVGARVSPTPCQARSECGSALLVDCDDRTRIESLAAAQGLAFQRIVELERQIDASRDRFC